MPGSGKKLMSLAQAIKKYIKNGSSITFGGFIGRDSVAAAREIIRQGIRDLHVIDDSSTDVIDLLLGAGCVRRWEGAYLGYGALGLGPNIRRAVEKGIPCSVTVEDWSNAAMSMRFLAGAINIPFIPTRSMLGSDLLKYHDRVKMIIEPFNGEQIAVIPAVRPDIAIIHVQKADVQGNAQIWGFLGNDENKSRAAKYTIITCEELVSTEEIRHQGNLTAIPFYCVDAVVHLPFGADPQSCFGYYAYDVLFCSEYYELCKTRDGYLKWLDNYVHGCKDHLHYCEKVGWERLFKLRRLEREFNNVSG